MHRHVTLLHLLFFRYDSKGLPIDCKLLDFQITRVASPALDINYLFFTSLNGDVRQEYLNDFLSNYYASFASTLASAKVLVPFTLNDLTKDYYSKNAFGLMTAAIAIPTILTDFENEPEMRSFSENISDKTTEAEIAKIMEDYNRKSTEYARKSSIIKPRFLSMFDELRESGLIGGGGTVNALIKSFSFMKS